MNKPVWFNRASGLAWVVLGIAAIPLGWANSVLLVWLASAYANAKTDWGAADASKADKILEAISELRKEVRSGVCHCAEPVHRER